MKFLVVIILFQSFLSFASCQKNENNSQIKSMSDLDTKSLSKLFQAIKAKNIENAELKKDEIVIGKTRIKVITTIEHDLSNQGKWIFAASYDTKLIDTNETVFTIGSIGIGSDRNDAEKTSIDEWIGLFGSALVEMLAKSEGIKIEDLHIYSGLMGIRGEKPSQSWLDGSPEMNKKIINVLLPIIKKSNKNIDSLNLILTVSKNGEVEGECRFNNEVSEEVLSELKKLSWGKNQTDFMFKQFYLIKKTALETKENKK
jgi:hypothetical protein